MALRLGRYFNTSAQFCMNLQTRYDLQIAQDASGKEIARAIRPRETDSIEQRALSSRRGRIRRLAGWLPLIATTTKLFSALHPAIG